MMTRFKRRLRDVILTVIIGAVVCAGLIPAGNYTAAKLKAVFAGGAPVNEFDGEHTDFPFRQVGEGANYGLISSEELGLKAPLYYGDTDEIFLQGAGQYMGSAMPGQGKTILAGGHDGTFFAPLEKAEKGDIIKVSTFYGDFEYEVRKTEIKRTGDRDIYQPKSEEELVLYTCYPFGQLTGKRDQRFFVYCDKVSGPEIKEDRDDAR